MRSQLLIPLLAMLVIAAADQALADTFIMHNTGTNVAGGIDQSWTITSSPYGANHNAYLSTNSPGFPYNGYWMANSATSSWIQPLNGYADNHSSASPYHYQTTFDLTGLDPASAEFRFRMSADNLASQVILNGHLLNLSHEGYRTFSDWFVVNNDAFFVGGVNTLAFEVINYPQATGNPTSLRVEFDQISADRLRTNSVSDVAVPEPASLIVWSLLAASGYGALRSKRRRASVAVAA